MEAGSDRRGPGSQVQEFLELFRAQRQDLQAQREARLEKLVRTRRERRREALLRAQGPAVKHERAWNPCASSGAKLFSTVPLLVARDCTEADKHTRPHGKKSTKDKRKPWVATRSGDCFGSYEASKPCAPVKEPRPKFRAEWRAPSCAPGKLFSTVLGAGRSDNVGVQRRIKTFQMQEEAAEREPWRPV